MPDLPTLLDLTNQRLAALSGWIDDHNAHRDAEARTWGRLAKLSEETGEAVAAYIGVTGQNPRKAILGHVGAVTDELYDVAITALGAVMHLHRNRPDADVIGTLLARIYDVCERAGLPQIEAPRAERPKAVHRVTWVDDVPTWHCDGDLRSACHWYPGCECEAWGSGHPHPEFPHERCWLLDWLENTWQDSHVGPDGELVEGTANIPHRDAPIAWDFEEDFVLWSYDLDAFAPADPSPAAQVATFVAVADGVTALVHGDEELTDEDRQALGIVIEAAVQQYAGGQAQAERINAFRQRAGL